MSDGSDSQDVGLLCGDIDIPSGDVECEKCGWAMSKLRTDWSPIAALHRVECIACPERGTVEIRGDDSLPAKTGVTCHGAASIRDGGTNE